MQDKMGWEEVIYFLEELIFQDLAIPRHTFRNIVQHMVGTQQAVTE